MVRCLRLVASVALLASTSACGISDKPATTANASKILANHDPQERFPNTDVKKVGILKTAGRLYEIYSLDFSNPISLHGMQRVAIIEGSKLVGTYQTDGAQISIVKNGLRFIDRSIKLHDLVTVTDGAFPNEVLINGSIRTLEPNI
jgi:hypothetical protein